MELETLHLNQMLGENCVRGWNDRSHKGSLHLLPLHFVLLLFSPPLVSAGRSSSLLGGHLGIVMSEASGAEGHAGKSHLGLLTHLWLWCELSQPRLHSLSLPGDIPLFKHLLNLASLF